MTTFNTYCYACNDRRTCRRCVSLQRSVDRFVEAFALDRLTVIPYQNWRALPEKAGIYFALDPDGGVVYIGQSQDLLWRWRTNHRTLYYSDAVSIGFILIDEHARWRLCLERTLIKMFKPSLHGVRKVPGPKLKEMNNHQRPIDVRRTVSSVNF